LAVNQEEFKKKLGIPVSGEIDPGYINAVSSGSNYTVPMAKSSVNSSNKKKATNPITWSPTGTLYNYPGNYNSPNYTPISREEALSQAMSELEPLIQRMRNTAIQQYQDYRNRIPDMINARAGTPLGGPRVIAEADLADEQARALSDIDLSGLAQALALAREIHAQDTRRADALENQAYQRWLDSVRMSMDAYKTDLGQRNIDRSFGLQELIANRDYELGLGSLDLSRLAEERARKSQEFDFERYFKSPEAQDWYLPLIKQQIEAGIAATNRSNIPRALRAESNNDDDFYNNAMDLIADLTNELTPLEERLAIARGEVSAADAAASSGIISNEEANRRKQVVYSVFPQLAPQPKPSYSLPSINLGSGDTWINKRLLGR
jgi:hypothetical protein